jgi:hypothetical protein
MIRADRIGGGARSPREAPIRVVSLGTVLGKRPDGLSDWRVWRRPGL